MLWNFDCANSKSNFAIVLTPRKTLRELSAPRERDDRGAFARVVAAPIGIVVFDRSFHTTSERNKLMTTHAKNALNECFLLHRGIAEVMTSACIFILCTLASYFRLTNVFAWRTSAEWGGLAG